MTAGIEAADDENDVENGASYTAEMDDLLADRLGKPDEPTDIYLEEANLYRPIVTGDIFRGVPVPGSTDDERAFDLTMVVAHPSAMRKGATLEPRARAAPVAPVNGLSRKKWASGSFNTFPLPLLAGVARENGFQLDNAGWGALLEFAAPIDTACLDVEQRVACLSPCGIELLLQRLVHADTRVPVKQAVLAKVFAPKLDEIEMLETWNEELVPTAVEGGLSLRDALAANAEDFEGVVAPLRAMLDSRTTAAEARRHLVAEIRSRRE